MRHAAAIVLIALEAALAAPAPATTADDLCAPTDDPCIVSGTRQVDDGSAINVGARELLVRGRLDVGPGTLNIVGAKLTVDGELRASGNDSTPGGTIRALAGSIAIDGTVDVSGSSGGTVEMGAAGRFAVGGAIDADHRAGDEGGGSISLDAGAMEVTGSLTARGGDDDSGGDVSLSARGALVLSGMVDVSGGDGGDIELAATADLTVDSSATLRTDATLVGCDGGDIDLSAGSPTNRTATLVMEGRMLSTGHAGNEDDGGGSGGTFTLSSTGNVALMRSGALLTATGGKPDGFGGDVDISAGGSVGLRAFVDVLSNGNDGSGGSLTIDADGAVELGGNVDASGDGGGEIDVSSRSASLNVASGVQIDARATGGGGGGTIQLTSEGALSVAGTLRTDGSNDVPGSLVQLEACTLRVEASGLLSSLKRQGKNVLVGRDATVVAGRLRADATSGANELRFASLEQQPVVLDGASIDPAPVEIVDASVHPCAAAPPTATATPSATPTATRVLAATATPTSTTVSTATPTPTPAGTATRPPPAPCVGDCNQDGAVTVDELVLATDIVLGRAPLARCMRLDRNSDGVTTVDEPIAAVTASLGGCLP